MSLELITLIEILTKGASKLKFNYWYLCFEENVIIIAMKRCLYSYIYCSTSNLC